MIYQSLSELTNKEVLAVFNEAFSDYIIAMPAMSEATFDWKILRDGVDYSLSPGLFDDSNTLQGFMLHAPGIWDGQRCIYNAGTGIIPTSRKKKGAVGLYQYILPRLAAAGYDFCLLECIVGNDRAMTLYKKTGFQKLRELLCFQGRLPPQDLKGLEVHIHADPPWQSWSTWWHHHPSWQNSIPAVMRVKETFQFYEFYQKGVAVAYAAFKANNGYLAHFAVHPDYRQQKIGSQVFYYLQSLTNKAITLVNIDLRDTASLSFLNHLGFKETVRQLELGRPI